MSLPVKIAIADSSVIIRSGMISLLCRITTFRSEVFEAADGERLKSILSLHHPDVVIINPSFAGHFSTTQIKKESGDHAVKIVALQTSLADSSALKAYDEVISAYDSEEQISEKLRKVVQEPEEDKRHESLSQREKEVIVCVVNGLTNKQIAAQLYLSTHTVITHRRNISAKLDIHSTAGLTIYAIVNQLVELDDIRNTPATL